MISRFPVLLVPPDWPIAHRWRLVSALYAQRLSLVEGSVATAIAVVACWQRTGWGGFGVLTLVCVATLVARLAQAEAFHRSNPPPKGAGTRTPEFWARQFTAGAALAACVWGATDICVMTHTRDQVTQIFVFMVQGGWLSGTCVRNASSPLSVVAQVGISAVCVCLSVLFVPFDFIWLVGVLAIISARAAINVGRQVGEDVLQAMRAELQLEAANTRLTELSSTDGLTGIGNRRAFDEKLFAEWARAARDSTELGLLLIDVDHFKLYNDRYGHPAGDACLRSIAVAVAATLRRPPDFAGRFGGEEFVALLPGTGTEGAREVADRVRLAVERLNLPHELSGFGRVSISLGVASAAPRPGDPATLLIERADLALYQAKQNGRNQVQVASHSVPVRAGSASRQEPELQGEAT